MLDTKTEKLYFLAIILIIGVFIVQLENVFAFRNVISDMNNTRGLDNQIILKDFSEVQEMIGLSLVVAILRQINKQMFKSTYDKWFRPYNYKDHDYKIDRMLHYQFSWIQYLLCLVSAFYLYKDHPNIYPQFGGGADSIFGPIKNWPDSENVAPLPQLKWYFQTNMAVHFHNLVHHMVCYTYIKNYVEMLLHHTITVILFFYSYYTNQFAWAVVVLMSHDIGDLFLSFAKWWRDFWEHCFEQSYRNQIMEGLKAKNQDLTETHKIAISKLKHPMHTQLYIVYAALCYFWFYGRIYLPMVTYIPQGAMLWYEGFTQTYGALGSATYWGFFFLLTCLDFLWLMNLLWFYAIMQAGIEKLYGTGNFTAVHEGETEKRKETHEKVKSN